ncbi:MAG TPA: hypothetical protein VF666_00985 [Pyrinomonadaceae bacterium]|jgi:hypothetical protein
MLKKRPTKFFMLATIYCLLSTALIPFASARRFALRLRVSGTTNNIPNIQKV